MELALARLRALPRALRLALVVVFALAVAAAVFTLPPVQQDPNYFGHADRRTLLGVPNALNVLSNLPFAAAAWLGLCRARSLAGAQRTAAVLVFVAVGAVTFGSSWYHLAPSAPGLLVDRLPISLAFSALFAWILGDRLGARWTALALGPLVALSAWTLWIWYGSGALDGDLRPYGLVQAVPLVCVPLLVALFPGELDDRRLATALCLYLLAKVCEHLDAAVYSLGEFVSGHTVKHLLAAWACVHLAPRARAGG